MHRTILAAGCCLAVLVWPVSGQPATAASPTTLQAVVVAVGPSLLTVRTEEGRTVAATLTQNTRVEMVGTRTAADVKPGAYIGSAAITAPDGTLRAQEVHIFPKPGIGEGHRQMGDDPKHTMTNATVTKITPAPRGEETLTLDYKGGRQQIVVAGDTPVIAMQMGTVGDLKPGMSVTLVARPEAGGGQTALMVLTGAPPR